MIIKTAELESVALDWAVAKIHGAPDELAAKQVMDGYSPSTNWAQGGPLIEGFIESSDDINIWVRGDDKFVGEFEYSTLIWCQSGSSILLAIMRAIVAAKLGDTVDVPEELL